MFLRSRSVVRHSCSSGLPLRTEAGWLLIHSESWERVSVFYQSPPPITMLTPWPFAVSREGAVEGVGAQKERSSSAGNWKHAVGEADGEERRADVCRCSGREDPIRMIIPDQFSDIKVCWLMPRHASLTLPLFMNIWVVNLSVQPQKAPLTARCDFARPPVLSVVFIILNK